MKYILILTILATACTKQHEPSVQWDVKIKQSGDTLTAVVYNSKSTNLAYIWSVTAPTGWVVTKGSKTIVLGKGRSEVQLSVLDLNDKNSSIAEYVTITR